MSTVAAETKRHGKHYTPKALARFLAERVLAQCQGGTDLSVLDPACGDGELLIAIHEVAAEQRSGVRLTLVGHDLDPSAIAVAEQRAEALGIDVQWRTGDSLLIAAGLPRASFDVIITNPPYVRTQQLGQAAAQLLSEEFGLTGRIDLTHPFVTLAPELLCEDGVLGLLSSNRFLTTKAGSNIRQVLDNCLDPVELYDLGDTKLFGAAVLPAITIAVNRERRGRCSFASAYEVRSERASRDDLYAALVADADSVVNIGNRQIFVKIGALAPLASVAEPWRMSQIAGDEWLAKIRAATWRSFGDIAKIRVGIKTTADNVFISSQWDDVLPAIEDELLLPLVTHHNVTPWRISSELAARVLYPYEPAATRRTVRDMSLFPNAMKYFQTHADQLKGRRYVIEAGRDWYEIWVPQRPHLWEVPKIVFPDISEHARFAYDTSGAVVNGDCYWISLSDIEDESIALLMMAVANSALGERFYDEVCGNKLYSGRRRWITQYVSRFPLPDPATDASRAVVAAVRNILALPDSAPGPKDLARIDALVEAAFCCARCRE